MVVSCVTSAIGLNQCFIYSCIIYQSFPHQVQSSTSQPRLFSVIPALTFIHFIPYYFNLRQPQINFQSSHIAFSFSLIPLLSVNLNISFFSHLPPPPPPPFFFLFVVVILKLFRHPTFFSHLTVSCHLHTVLKSFSMLFLAGP